MKLLLTIATACLTKPTTLAFAPSASKYSYNDRSTTSLYANKVGVYFSTTTGNCETIAGYISQAGGVEMNDIGDASDSDLLGLDSIIVGAPTWHTDADMERSGTEWDSWLYNTLPNIDLSGKNVAVFGVGDQQSYNDVSENLSKKVMNDLCEYY